MKARVARVIAPFMKKDLMDRRYRRLIWRYQNRYYISNLPYNGAKTQELVNDVGPLMVGAHLLMDKMDCALMYQREDNDQVRFTKFSKLVA